MSIAKNILDNFNEGMAAVDPNYRRNQYKQYNPLVEEIQSSIDDINECLKKLCKHDTRGDQLLLKRFSDFKNAFDKLYGD